MTKEYFIPNPPTLSTKERDYRWGGVRAAMRRKGVDVLLIPPAPLRYPADTYFTNDIPACAVVFPLEGDPVAIHRGASVAGSWLQAREWGEGTWIEDMRFGPRAKIMVQALKEKGLDKGRIGTIGALGGPNLLPYGWTPQPLWAFLKESLPDAEFVEFWDDFEPVWLVKSQEDLALFRYVSRISEQASQVMLDVTRPGVPETEIFSAISHEFHRNGATMAHDLFVHSGPDNLSWDAPRWLYRAQRPRVVQEGDVVMSEMMPLCGGMEAQAQMCIAVGKVHEDFHRAAGVARESYEAALGTIRAGIPFGQVAEAMQKPLQRAGAWHLTPHLHSTTPLTLVSAVTEGLDESIKSAFKRVDELGGQGLDVILKPGMTLQVEPNAAFGRRQVNIGGNVIVTENGYEELNSVPTRMRFV